MTFSFGARGSAAEVLSSLNRLSDEQLGHDRLAEAICDLICDVIEDAADPPSGQKYQITVSGSSGRDTAASLSAEIKLISGTDPELFPEYVPKHLSEQAKATESLGIS